VCYLNPETGYAEPLLAIYEVSAIKKLLPYFQSGQTSLLHFLKSISTHFITGNALSLKSIDNPSGKNE
jgi:molybdopterin-guanine dinucleotide biosynthesis protein A